MQDLFIVLLIAALGGLGYAYWRLQNQFIPQLNQQLTKQLEQLAQQQAEMTQLSASLKQSLLEAKAPPVPVVSAEPVATAEITALEAEVDVLKQALHDAQASLEAAQTAQREAEAQVKTQIEAQTASEQAADVQPLPDVLALQTAYDALQEKHTYQLSVALTLANASYDGLLVLDEQYQVLATNTAAEKLFSITEHTNRQLSELTQSPELQMMVEDVLLNEEEILEEQMTFHERSYLVRAQIIRRDANRFIGLALQDVTQLIRLNRARRDMVANISHELRTPIANIRVIIDGLFHDQDKPKRKDSISSLRTIARETDALLWLVQEMADLSMIESGQSIVRMIDVSLADVMNEACDRLTDQLAYKQLHLVRQIPANLRVLCDRDLIQRVIVNLVHNAMKWSPPNETITITAESGEEEVIISVFDRGTGVPDDQIDRIFERFYQVDASRSGNEGTGLGLAICKHIVVAHGGRIWAEGNSAGSGGRFRFTLLSAESPVEVPPYPVNATMIDDLSESLE